jgi:hypothetical protein
MRAAFSVIAAILAFSSAAAWAQNCPLPPVLQTLQPGIDIFNDEQEADLGDAMAEQLAPRLKIIDNEPLPSIYAGWVTDWYGTCCQPS